MLDIVKALLSSYADYLTQLNAKTLTMLTD